MERDKLYSLCAAQSFSKAATLLSLCSAADAWALGTYRDADGRAALHVALQSLMDAAGAGGGEAGRRRAAAIDMMWSRMGLLGPRTPELFGFVMGEDAGGNALLWFSAGADFLTTDACETAGPTAHLAGAYPEALLQRNARGFSVAGSFNCDVLERETRRASVFLCRYAVVLAASVRERGGGDKPRISSPMGAAVMGMLLTLPEELVREVVMFVGDKNLVSGEREKAFVLRQEVASLEQENESLKQANESLLEKNASLEEVVAAQEHVVAASSNMISLHETSLSLRGNLISALKASVATQEEHIATLGELVAHQKAGRPAGASAGLQYDARLAQLEAEVSSNALARAGGE
jgi:hypothetical protein